MALPAWGGQMRSAEILGMPLALSLLYIERCVEESADSIRHGGVTAPRGYTNYSIPPEEAKMHIIGWIVFGLVVGAIAKLLMPGPDPGGWIVTILLGIAGAMVGGFLGRAAGWYGPNDAAGFLMSLLGALVLLGLYRFAVGRHA
jgi:uncharacterized membrane protein YeaQ/YmgE (transglycosylase-associated protein family)